VAGRGADDLIRTICTIADAQLRLEYMVSILRDRPAADLGPILDAICARAEQAEPDAREVMTSLVIALHDPAVEGALMRLREEAAGEGLFALERAVRSPSSVHTSGLPEDPDEDRVPDYGRGRPLTLGERKSLARKPDRGTMERLLRDPHPDVIARLLANPRLTEDDVLAMAVKRPARPDVLTQIALNVRFGSRPRIRRALVLNPDTPQDLAASISALLLRQELRLVVGSPQVSPALRALCMEHLERRPPGEEQDEPDGDLLQ
jgi:hypothetical protein